MAELDELWEGFEYLPHQVPAIHKMLALERDGTPCPALGRQPAKTVFGGMNCDDMGLGKTIEVLSTLHHNRKKATLLLCPLALIENWVDNGERAGMRVHVVSAERTWTRTTDDTFGPSLFVVNYDKLTFDGYAHLFARPWNRIVLDEAHRIRNHNSALSKAVLKLSVTIPIKWAVTGTPVVNSMKDATTLLAFLGVPHLKTMSWLPTYYQPLVNELVFHRSMNDIRDTVPGVPLEPIIEDHIIEFATEQEQAFYRHLQGLVTRLRIAYARGDFKNVLLLLLRLRQSSMTPKLLEPTWDGDSSKMLHLKSLVEAEPDEKFIVFCWFHEEMALLQEMLEPLGSVEMYHGGLTQSERSATLARAKSPECKVILIQFQAGGVGLNLQEFSRVVFMSPWWTAAMMQQAIGRAVRMGQKKQVKVMNLLLAEEEGMNIDTFTNSKVEAKRLLLEKFFEHRALI
jgi:transcription termination factor 2